jgi:hypothetical protein
VLACSSRKVSSAGLLPAIERYDGVAYRVVKRLQRLGQYPKDVDLLIISAKYGIIQYDHPIPTYDLRMTPEQALEQAEENHNILSRFLHGRSISEVFISAGKEYLLGLEPFDAWRGEVRVRTNKGKIGLQLKALKDWLLWGDRNEGQPGENFSTS